MNVTWMLPLHLQGISWKGGGGYFLGRSIPQQLSTGGFPYSTHANYWPDVLLLFSWYIPKLENPVRLITDTQVLQERVGGRKNCNSRGKYQLPSTSLASYLYPLSMSVAQQLLLSSLVFQRKLSGLSLEIFPIYFPLSHICWWNFDLYRPQSFPWRRVLAWALLYWARTMSQRRSLIMHVALGEPHKESR